jgi:hypothetical protein
MKIAELLQEAPRVSEETKRVRAIIKQWREEIKANPQFGESAFGHFELTPNNELIHKGRALVIRNYMLDENGELTIKIHSCYKLSVATPKIKSFKNFPNVILKDYRNKVGFGRFDWSLNFGGVYSNDERYTHITSLEGITPDVQGGIDMSMLEKVNFSNVDKYIKSCTVVAIDRDYVGPLLGFLKIPNLQKITGPTLQNATTNKEKACAIINEHLKDKRSILACQRDLMKAQLLEYAKL